MLVANGHRNEGFMRRLCGLLMVLVVAWAAGPSFAEEPALPVQGVRVKASQPDPRTLVLDLWPAPAVTVSRVGVEIDGVALVAGALAPYPAPGQTTAVLLLVDTSDPVNRRRDVRQAARDIAAIVDHAGDHTRFGIARLAADFELLVPVGTDRAKVKATAAKLTARGATTELFRNTIAGIDSLVPVNADRKVLILLSDGRREDTAFTHRDVVEAAQSAGVAVVALGYSRTRGGTRWFQNLRRISDATGGVFIPANQKLKLPDKYRSQIFAITENKGRATLDLAPVIAARVGGAHTARVTLEIDGRGPVTFAVPVTLPPVTLALRLSDPRNRLFVIAGGLAALALVAFGGLALVRRRHRLRAARAAEAAAAEPYAYLEFFDDAESRHPVRDQAVRLGRNPDNDVPLNNTSVSAYHAEIQRRRDGTFIVTDLDSLNGVAINDEPVDVGRLDDGDIVDLGEVRFRFRLNPDRPAPI